MRLFTLRNQNTMSLLNRLSKSCGEISCEQCNKDRKEAAKIIKAAIRVMQDIDDDGIAESDDVAVHELRKSLLKTT